MLTEEAVADTSLETLGKAIVVEMTLAAAVSKPATPPTPDAVLTALAWALAFRVTEAAAVAVVTAFAAAIDDVPVVALPSAVLTADAEACPPNTAIGAPEDWESEVADADAAREREAEDAVDEIALA